ncbi:MAG: hypothetical protein ACXWPX_12015 [Pseudobdellovibrio sp.]
MKHINKSRSLIKITPGLTAMLLLLGCASTQEEKPKCRDIASEPVSTCRAEEKCKLAKTSYGFGLAPGIGSNLGMELGETQNTENYIKCIDRNLAEQRAAAEIEDTEKQENETNNDNK